MKVIKIGLILVVGLFILFVGIGTFYEPSAESLRKEKEGCSRALMSSIEAPVRTYADKAAYDAVVREKCKGMSINGKPVAP